VNRDQAELMIGTGQTQRFHTELTLRSQDVGQHCYGVFWLCYALTAGEMSNALMLAAMSHDAGERWTGDLPGPTKLRMNLTAQFDAEEDRELMTRVGFPRPVLKPTERAVLKLADAFDGAYYCLRELRMGNATVRTMMENFLSYAHAVLASRSAAVGGPVFGRANEHMKYLEEQVNGNKRG